VEEWNSNTIKIMCHIKFQNQNVFILSFSNLPLSVLIQTGRPLETGRPEQPIEMQITYDNVLSISHDKGMWSMEENLASKEFTTVFFESKTFRTLSNIAFTGKVTS